MKTAGTSDEMVALMNEGGFDLVTASGDASMRLIAGKRVQPINVALMPELRQGRPAPAEGALALRQRPALRRALPVGLERADVQHQGVRRQEADLAGAWCSRSRTCPTARRNKGRVQAFDGPIYIADAALYLMKKKPELGIKDPYELNEAQYKAALELLRGQRKLVGKYWHDAFVQIDDFTNEGVVASSSWQFQANILGSKKAPIATVVPVEGATGWADTTMMHAEAKNPNCAYMWLEHSLNPKLQGDLSAWFGSVPVGAGGLQGQRAARRRGLRAPGPRIASSKISFWKTPTTKCKTQNDQCVPYHKWVSDYIAVLGGPLTRSRGRPERLRRARAAPADQFRVAHDRSPSAAVELQRCPASSSRRQAGARGRRRRPRDRAPASSSPCSGPRARARPPACA